MTSELKIKALGLDLRPETHQNDQCHVFEKKAREKRIADVFKHLPPKRPIFTSKCPLCGMRVRGRRDYGRHREAAHGIKPTFYKGYSESTNL